jgi:flagellar basal-body rod modification protein FlgD
MTVSSTGSSTTQSILDKLNGTVNGGKPATATNNSTLDQTAFLKLLTTQLKTQDPTQPVDNTQMLAQLAQFSSVSGIAEMNASLKAMASDISASRVGDAASWIGKSALVSSSTMTPFSDGTYAGELSLPSDVTNVSISFTDSNGQQVFSKTLGAQSAGALPFTWNGKDDNGATVATGPLTVKVTATGTDGTVTPTVSTWTQITGVQSPAAGDTKLVTALGQIAPADAERLSS